MMFEFKSDEIQRPNSSLRTQVERPTWQSLDGVVKKSLNTWVPSNLKMTALNRTSGQQMAQPIARLRLGCFQLPIEESRKIRALFVASAPHTAIDPCAGDGIALIEITHDTEGLYRCNSLTGKLFNATIRHHFPNSSRDRKQGLPHYRIVAKIGGGGASSTKPNIRLGRESSSPCRS
jgi:hypothetical protein